MKAETFESQQVEHIYVVGDATVAAPMPKSGFCANAQAKVVAAAIAASLESRSAPQAYWTNTCYSLVGPDYGISVAGVYRVQEGVIAEVEGPAASARRMPPVPPARWKPNMPWAGTTPSARTPGERSSDTRPRSPGILLGRPLGRPNDFDGTRNHDTMSHTELVAWSGLLIGLVFGATGQTTGFCLLRGSSTAGATAMDAASGHLPLPWPWPCSAARRWRAPAWSI